MGGGTTLTLLAAQGTTTPEDCNLGIVHSVQVLELRGIAGNGQEDFRLEERNPTGKRCRNFQDTSNNAQQGLSTRTRKSGQGPGWNPPADKPGAETTNTQERRPNQITEYSYL